MKTIELSIPDEVYEKLENLASQEHQSVNEFASRKMEELVRALEDFDDLERRAKRGSWERFNSAMAKVRDVPPMPGDEK